MKERRMKEEMDEMRALAANLGISIEAMVSRVARYGMAEAIALGPRGGKHIGRGIAKYNNHNKPSTWGGKPMVDHHLMPISGTYGDVSHLLRR